MRKIKLILTIIPSFLVLIFLSNCSENDSVFVDDPLPYPARINVISINETSLKVEWEDVLSYCDNCNYQIERAEDSLDFVTLQNEFKLNYYIDNNVDQNKKYAYRIKTYNNLKSSHSAYHTYVRYDFVNDLKDIIETQSAPLLKLSNNSLLLASLGKNSISIWYEENNSLLRTIQDQAEYINNFYFSSDDSKLSYCADSSIKTVNLSDGSVINSVILNQKCLRFAHNSEMSRILAKTYTIDKINYEDFWGCYNNSSELLWSIDSLKSYGEFYNSNLNEFVVLVKDRLLFLNPDDGSVNFQYSLDARYYAGSYITADNKSLVSFCETAETRTFFLTIDLLSRNVNKVEMSGSRDFKYIKAKDEFIYGENNTLRFHKWGAEYYYFSFAPLLEEIYCLEYSFANGDIIISEYNGKIYTYSANKSKKWFAYPYYY